MVPTLPGHQGHGGTGRVHEHTNEDAAALRRRRGDGPSPASTPAARGNGVGTTNRQVEDRAAPGGSTIGFQLLTQNVRGLAKTRNRPADWFSGFRALHLGFQVDAIFLQETRATQNWACKLEDSYARAWGYDSQKVDSPLSYWQPTPAAAGGVAILLHPLSSLRTLAPLWQESWDSHFMALSGPVDGREVTLVCVYAPTNKRLREGLFRRLRQLRPPGDVVVIGGDFNCVLDEERDRSRAARTNTDSPELRRLLHAWRLVDSVAADSAQAQSYSELLEFHANSHTYSYRLPDGTSASSRLDRWYVSLAEYESVSSTMTAAPVGQSDHDAVFLTVSSAAAVEHTSKVGRRALKYPLPEYAAAAMQAVSDDHVASLAEKSTEWTAKTAAECWDDLKTELRRNCLTAKRHAAQRLTNSLRQRIRRATAALAAEKRRRLITTGDNTGDAVKEISMRMELLTLDPWTREASLRRHLIALQHDLATRRQRRAIHQYDGQSPSATRAFFRRMSERFSRPRIVGPRGGSRPDSVTATQLALDWLPIVQQQPTTVEAQDEFFERIIHRAATPATALASDDADFTVAEVLAAIAACPNGKASGPDGIPNDWYKTVAQPLAPILARVFSLWAKHEKLPASFTDATVFCLPKVSSPRNGLDFRPISLLNTDYKIFSRLILQRVKQQVEHKVSTAQFGFVGNRQVHDAIDVWAALQARVAAGELPATATAVMLDFAKAYDTLDRTFLRRALAFHGFDRKLVATVDAMHLATTARFLADGDMSDVVDIHNGIRQGCPLAPVLFILALDVLYKAAEEDPALHGLELAADVAVTLSGYADDTTAYLPHPQEEPPLLRLLELFGAASGLKINVHKSRAVAMHPQGPTVAHAKMHIPVMASTDLLRLLGMAVASSPRASDIWSRTFQQIRATLHIATVKTTNIQQRIQICQAVIMPKLLFVGRHAWPTGTTFDSLQRLLHQYAWHATVAEGASGGRAWMSAGVAMLPVRDGGLGLPDVRAAFISMSAKTVARWNNASNPVTTAAGAILRRLCGGGPANSMSGSSRLATRTPSIVGTLAATGHTALRTARALPRPASELEALAPLLPATGGGRIDEKWWDNGWLHAQYDDDAAALSHLRTTQRRLHGEFSLAPLLAAPATTADVVLQDTESAVSRGAFPGLIQPDDTIGDVIQVRWVAPRHVCFRCRRHDWPLSPRLAEHFRRFCDALVRNYPAILLPQNDPDELQPRPPAETVWRLRRMASSTILVREPLPGVTIAVGVVHSMRQAAQLARLVEPTLRRFDPHPALDAYAPIWTHPPPMPARASMPVSAARERAQREVVSRAQKALTADPIIGAALASISWQAVARLPASASRQRLMLHKIKGLRLSGWDRSNGRRGCPHCPAPRVGDDVSHTYHIMWHCSQAQALWSQLRAGWEALGASFADQVFCKDVFSLRLSHTPTLAWTLIDLRGDPTELVSTVHAIVALVWQQQVLGCFQQIWSWRHGLADEALPWTLSIASSALRSAFKAAYHQVAATLAPTGTHRSALQRLLYGMQELQLTADPPAPRRSPQATDQFLLYFDGGSRGNPGAGGAGAVVVRTDAFGGSPFIIWAAAMSLASSSTTNNQAEYFGLVTGLRFASKTGLQPLTIIGDSAMIVTQLREHRPPKAPSLKRRYAEARVMADMLGVIRWCHHVRAYNRMADCAANLAMDAKASTQTLDPLTRPYWASLATHLHEDVAKWQASTSPGLTNAS